MKVTRIGKSNIAFFSHLLTEDLQSDTGLLGVIDDGYPAGVVAFTVNGREYPIVKELAPPAMKGVIGKSASVNGEEQESMTKLLEEYQELLERTYYVSEEYKSSSGGAFVFELYREDHMPRLEEMQNKIAAKLNQ